MMTRRVLLVDDDREFLELSCSVLEEQHPEVTVTAANSGTAALALISEAPGVGGQKPFDVAILDLRLGDMTAVDVLRRAQMALAGVPILVLTQALWKGDEAAVLAAGATLVLEKPSKLLALRRLLDVFVASGHPPSE